jgi:hypothetical protein
VLRDILSNCSEALPYGDDVVVSYCAVASAANRDADATAARAAATAAIAHGRGLITALVTEATTIAADATSAAAQAAASAVSVEAQGGAAQVDPMKLKLKAPGTKRLKLKCDEPLSNFAFDLNLRRYSKEPSMSLRERRQPQKSLFKPPPPPPAPPPLLPRRPRPLLRSKPLTFDR